MSGKILTLILGLFSFIAVGIKAHAYDDFDTRYKSVSELQEDSGTPAPRPKSYSKSKNGVKKKAAQKRAVGKKKLTKKTNGKVATKTSAVSSKKKAIKKAPVKKKVVQKVSLDPMEVLEESLPKEREEINKSLDAIEHVRTFYRISRGANISDLQKDDRFNEIYKSMKPETKRSFYYYLKGIYQNSAQAIKDKQAASEGSVSKLTLNRKYSPTETDIDGFNERSAIKSKLVRNLQGTYVRRAKAAKTAEGEEVPAGSESTASTTE